MKYSFLSSLLIMILGIIISSLIYSLSPFKIGNRADIIEFQTRLYYFFLLFIISNFLLILLKYVFKIQEIYILIVTNVSVFLLTIAVANDWKSTAVLIYFPVFFLLSILVLMIAKYRNQNKLS